MYSGYNSLVTTITGESSSDWAGYSIAGGQDIDGDGYDDYVIGAPRDDDGGSDAGATYVVFAPVSAVFSLINADEKLIGESPDDLFGSMARSPGDLNGDGYADVVASGSATDLSAYNAGTIYLFTSRSSRIDASAAEARIDGPSSSARLGSAGADFSWGGGNGDGNLDILVGCSQCYASQTGGMGMAYLLYGPLAGSYDLSGSGTADAEYLAEDGSTQLGYSTTLASDMDGDGRGDVVIGGAMRRGGSSMTEQQAGAVYVFYE